MNTITVLNASQAAAMAIADRRARAQFIELFATLDEAITFETQTLSIGDEFLPEIARAVRDADSDDDQTTELYWRWLASQVELPEGWNPSHLIEFIPDSVSAEPEYWLVMLDEELPDAYAREQGVMDGDGPAYTRTEWDQDDSASWCVDGGVWLCQGQVTPGGRSGTVTVIDL